VSIQNCVVIGGGQAGLAAANAAARRGITPLVLEAGRTPAGSWRDYYESLRLFTPVHFNELPAGTWAGEPNRYPTGAEVAQYLEGYAERIGAEIRTDTRVDSVQRYRGGYLLHTTSGTALHARTVIAATGSFANPYRPELAGLAGYRGTVIHAAQYRAPEPFTGQRVVVVGSGNSAVQIAMELAGQAVEVVLATRHPIRYATNEPIPAEARFWTALTWAGRLPIGRFIGHSPIPVIDTEGYRQAIDEGKPQRRTMFGRAEGRRLIWPDGRTTEADTVVLATGYRPALAYLAGMEHFDQGGHPVHRRGVSKRHRGLGYVGLEYQTTMLSGTMHGAGRDAARTVAALLS